MPFPATRHTVPNVGSSGGQRPGANSCTYAQVRGLLWGGQLEDRQIRSLDVRKIRRRHVRVFPEETAATPLAWETHGCGAGQRPIPPRNIVGTPAAQIPQGVNPAVPAAIQPATGSCRADLEAGAAARHTQPVLRHLGRIAPRSRIMFRLVEKTECGIV
jgi:hypothetical protein